MGDVKPWFMGEKTHVCHLIDFPSSLVNLFNVLFWLVEVVMAAGG